MYLFSLLILFGVLQCSLTQKGGLTIHVDKNGTDTLECIQGTKSCLTLNYVLYSLQAKKPDLPAVEILVSTSQKFNCAGIYDFNFTSLTITNIGGDDVIFSGLFGMSFEPNLKDVFVHMKGIHYENCRPTTQNSDPFNPGVVFAFISHLILEECTVRYGSTLVVRVQNLTIDSSIFSDFNSSTLPVLTSWVSFPGLAHKFAPKWASASRKPLPLTTRDEETSKVGTIVVRNSTITNSTGIYMGPSDDYPGPGIMIVDLSRLPIDTYFDIVHYDILIVDCNFTNNNFIGHSTPLLYSMYGQNFSSNFTIVNCNFINNTITPDEHGHNFYSFSLLSLSMNTNTSTNFTVMECSFVNYSLPPSVLLGTLDSVHVNLNVFDSTFGGHGVTRGLQVIQDWSETSSNYISTNFKGNKHV